MLRIATLLGMGLLTATAAGAASPSRQRVPIVYEAGHFYAVPETTQGKTIRLLVDTGGAGGSGWYVIGSSAAQRLGLDVNNCALNGEQFKVVKSPTFHTGKGLPFSSNMPCGSAALVIEGIDGMVDGEDGVLGAGYLPGHVWTFDYPGKQLWLEPKLWRPPVGTHRTALAFQMNARGKLGSGMARITLKVDGQPLDLLLDTGATAKPTATGEQASGTQTEHGIGVTSYITSSVLDHWRQLHPDWRVVADGDDLFGSQHATRLIEVPKVDIAGWVIGPVWFTERPDANFHDFMSKYTDQRIEGSAGGNIFASFAMTIDYPARVAWFTCSTHCVTASEK